MALRISPVCPFAGISVCATRTSLQTEQCLPSVLPGSVQVAATAGSTTSVCPFAGISSMPERIASHFEHLVPALCPGLVQVAGCSAISTGVCPVASSASVLVSLQTVQVYVLTPAFSQVAAVVILPSSQRCPVAGTSVCSTSTSLQTAQCLPSVSPVFVQVAATAGSTTSVCPFAGIIS